MAIAVVTTGPAHIQVDTGASNALESLGYTRNGVEIIETVFSGNVAGDQNGGDDGPPIDVQYFGQIDRVRIELTKFDTSILDKVRPRLYGGTAGSIGTSGTLWAGGAKTYRLLIEPTSLPRNYIMAIPREPIEVNRGTRFSTVIMEWECHASGGVLWNTTTS